MELPADFTLRYLPWNLQVETYGSMERREKVEFILEQMRLCLAKKDYIRTQIISKKISPKFFENNQEQVCELQVTIILRNCTCHMILNRWGCRLRWIKWIRQYSTRLSRIIVLLFNKLSMKCILQVEKSAVMQPFACLLMIIGNLVLICYVQMIWL